MGVADLRDAFNAVARPAFVCDRATLGYVSHEGRQWQILRFSGRTAAGAPFEAESDRLDNGVDVNLAARAVAQGLVDGLPG